MYNVHIPYNVHRTIQCIPYIVGYIVGPIIYPIKSLCFRDILIFYFNVLNIYNEHEKYILICT